jgi:hypothetical protein
LSHLAAFPKNQPLRIGNNPRPASAHKIGIGFALFQNEPRYLGCYNGMSVTFRNRRLRDHALPMSAARLLNDIAELRCSMQVQGSPFLLISR